MGAIRDLIMINHDEFVSCDDSGQMIIWNSKDNKMKGFSLKSIGASISEPMLCLCLTEERGKFLIAGLK